MRAQEMRWVQKPDGYYFVWCGNWPCSYWTTEDYELPAGNRRYTSFYQLVGRHWCRGKEHPRKRKVNAEDLCFDCWQERQLAKLRAELAAEREGRDG